MKQVKFFAVALSLVIAGALNANAQKIAAVDVDGLMGSLPEAQKAQQEFQKWSEDSIGSQYAKLYNELVEKDSLSKIEKNPSVKELLVKRATEIQGILGNWQQNVAPYQQQKRAQLFGPIYNKVMDAVRAYAKEKGYAYVLTQEAFVVAPDSDNISIPVAQRLGIKVDSQGNPVGGAGPTTPAKTPAVTPRR